MGWSVETEDSEVNGAIVLKCVLEQLYSTLFVRVPPDIFSFQLSTPKVIGAQFKLYIV